MKTYSGVKAAMIVVIDGVLGFAMVKNAKDIDAVVKAGAPLFEDWETARKVAFSLSTSDGVCTTPVTLTNRKDKVPLFVPEEGMIPNWAQTVSRTQALENIRTAI